MGRGWTLIYADLLISCGQHSGISSKFQVLILLALSDGLSPAKASFTSESASWISDESEARHPRIGSRILEWAGRKEDHVFLISGTFNPLQMAVLIASKLALRNRLYWVWYRQPVGKVRKMGNWWEKHNSNRRWIRMVLGILPEGKCPQVALDYDFLLR